MPPDDGLRLNDDERRAPVRPGERQPDLQASVNLAESEAVRL
jgi:hypothetical protein